MKDPSTPVVLTNILLGFSKALDGAVSNSTVTSPLHTAFAEVPAKFQRFPLLLQGGTQSWSLLPETDPSSLHLVHRRSLHEPLWCSVFSYIFSNGITKESIWNELRIPCNRKQNSSVSPLLHGHLHGTVLRSSGIFTELVLTRIHEDTIQQHLEVC